MIILLTNEFPPKVGGVGTYSFALARSINKLNQHIAVITTNEIEYDFYFDKVQSFQIYRVKEYSLSFFRHAARFNSLFLWTIKLRPSLLWGVDWRTGIVVCMIATFFNLPYAVSAHGTEVVMATRSSIKRLIAKIVFNMSSVIISNSNYTKRLLKSLGISQDKIVIANPGVEPNEWQIDQNQKEVIISRHNLANKKIILTFSRIVPRKGIDVVIKAMPIVLNSVADSMLVIAGRGEDEDRLRKLVKSLGIDNYVTFVGFVRESEKPLYFNICDVYVMASRQEGNEVEGFGISLLEAAACGKPSIAGRHGGVQDAVIDGVTGLLVDQNNPKSLAQAIIKLLDDKKLAEKLGQNARHKVEFEANWDNIARHILKVFQRIL